jgi:hypothetical protein
MTTRLAALAVADEPAAWTDAGFAVDDGGRCWLGDVAVALTPGTGTGTGVQAWSVEGVDGPLDGLPALDLPPEEPVDAAVLHPNGTTAVDHVVVMTPDLDRTVAALEQAGLESRRVRDADAGGRPIRQVFFRLGDPVLEVVGPPEPSGDGPARFFGLALTVADLDATATALGEHLGEVKDAVQAGRRIATLRRSAGCTTALAFMSPPPR